MPILFSQFAKNIDPKILQRGKDIYKAGDIQEFEELSADHFCALIEGTETYTTSIKLKGDYIDAHECDCPYDWGRFL